MSKPWLVAFVRESNRIEGITREPTAEEVEAHVLFADEEWLAVSDLTALVGVLQPDAVLRDRQGLNVRVGNHIAPPGGPAIRTDLENLLNSIKHDYSRRPAYWAHQAYETLHPFTDGNGRSGRALWLWMMLRGSDRDAEMARQLGFLHTWYYQSLEASRA